VARRIRLADGMLSIVWLTATSRSRCLERVRRQHFTGPVKQGYVLAERVVAVVELPSGSISPKENP
jgi:hypothetical protein